MQLELAGHPLHTRAIAVTLRARADGRLDAHAALLDLRKRGVVPVGGDLQAPGIIHHMLLDGVVDPAVPRLDEVRGAQPSVAFEASALTEGESCRDPIEAVRTLGGARLDDGFAKAVGAVLGGPRGCSHVFVLAHALGAAVGAALAAGSPAPAFRPGERVFRRDVVVDGNETAPGRILLATQLTDVHFAPAAPLARPMDRFGAHREVRLLAGVDLASFAFDRVAGAERWRRPDTLRDAAWQSHDAALGPLAGTSLTAGVTNALFARFGARAEDRPLLDALLVLAPTVIQCMAALSETWPLAAQGSRSRVGIGGIPDSCYMWRRGGALARARESEGDATLKRPETHLSWRSRTRA